jgi:hypothetical protein
MIHPNDQIVLKKNPTVLRFRKIRSLMTQIDTVCCYQHTDHDWERLLLKIESSGLSKRDQAGLRQYLFVHRNHMKGRALPSRNHRY